MALRKVAVVAVFVLALLTIPARVAGNNSVGLKHFHIDGAGMLLVSDISKQTMTVEGSFIGDSATLEWQFNNINVQSDGTENCAHKYGTATLTAVDGTINMSLGGSGCAAVSSATGETSAVYWITGGTGRFSAVKGGSGSFSWGWAINGAESPMSVHIAGNILFPGK